MDPVKEAFKKIKEDIFVLQNQINTNYLLSKIEQINNKIDILSKNNNPTYPTDNPTYPTDNPTYINNIEKKTFLNSLKTQNYNFSIGNDGVPTNKQTDKPTNQQKKGIEEKNNSDTNYFNEASNILENLDNVKKEIRRTFKNLTNQEMLIFSTLYDLDEKKTEDISYKLLADILKLSESSIRDYINKLINKGILIEKYRINNKKIILKISNKLKEISSLSTIIKLRNM
jgi:hypothetical protein